MLSKDIISATLKITKESGFSTMTALSILSTPTILRASVLVDLLPMMMSMIGRKGRIAKVHIFWFIETLPRKLLSWKLILLLKRIKFCRLLIFKRNALLSQQKLSAKRNLLNLKKREAHMLKILKNKEKKWRFKWNKFRWLESTKVRMIFRLRVKVRWWRMKNGRRMKKMLLLESL